MRKIQSNRWPNSYQKFAHKLHVKKSSQNWMELTETMAYSAYEIHTHATNQALNCYSQFESEMCVADFRRLSIASATSFTVSLQISIIFVFLLSNKPKRNYYIAAFLDFAYCCCARKANSILIAMDFQTKWLDNNRGGMQRWPQLPYAV